MVQYENYSTAWGWCGIVKTCFTAAASMKTAWASVCGANKNHPLCWFVYPSRASNASYSTQATTYVPSCTAENYHGARIAAKAG